MNTIYEKVNDETIWCTYIPAPTGFTGYCPLTGNTEMPSLWLSSFNTRVDYYSRISYIDTKHLKRTNETTIEKQKLKRRNAKFASNRIFHFVLIFP